MVEVIMHSLSRTVLTLEEQPATSGSQIQVPVAERLKFKELTKPKEVFIEAKPIPLEPVESTWLAQNNHFEKPSR